MKKRYSISFFAVIFICLMLLGFAYQMSYSRAKAKAENSENHSRSVATDGNAVKSDLYYLKDLNGFIAVYQNDKKTIFEYTNIRVDELPADVAAEVCAWKSVETLENLYGFLENYSS